MKKVWLLLFVLLGASFPTAEWKMQELPSPAAPGSAQPYLAARNGKVYLSWLDKSALKFSAWDGKSWSAPQIIVAGKPFFVNWADFPSLLPSSNGFASHWLEKTGKSTYAYSVMTSLSKNGSDWSSPIRVHSDASDTEHGFTTMMEMPDGKLGYIWLDGRSKKEMALMYATYDHGAFHNESVLDVRVCDCCQTDGGVTSDGAIVAYRDRSGSEVRDISYVRLVNGRWSSPKTIHTDNWKINGCPVNGPAVATRGKNVAIAWFTGAGEKGKVQVALSKDSGATFGKPLRIDQASPLGRVDAVWINDREAVISWMEQSEIRIRKVSMDGTLGVPFTVANSSTARSSGFPRMAAMDGKLLIAWTFAAEPSRVRVMSLN